MIGKTISHYRIVEKLGEGGMGVVYIAEDTLLGRRVAFKMLMPDRDERHFRSRFLREARAVSALSHPNIAAVHDYGETEDGQPYIVMELVKGETLGDLMVKESLTIARAVEIIEQVAAALGEAHSFLAGSAVLRMHCRPSALSRSNSHRNLRPGDSRRSSAAIPLQFRCFERTRSHRPKGSGQET